VFAAVDALDADGELRVLLCADCGRALRRFVDGERVGAVEGVESVTRPDRPGDRTDDADG
jgi:hypothetical protein